MVRVGVKIGKNEAEVVEGANREAELRNMYARSNYDINSVMKIYGEDLTERDVSYLRKLSPEDLAID
jgi:hypothetical protein